MFLIQKYHVVIDNTFAFLKSRDSKETDNKQPYFFPLLGAKEYCRSLMMTYSCETQQNWEVLQFLFSLIMLILAWKQSGNSCFVECHQQFLSVLNYSVVPHDIGGLCVKRLRIFKNPQRGLVGSLRKLSDTSEQSFTVNG